MEHCQTLWIITSLWILASIRCGGTQRITGPGPSPELLENVCPGEVITITCRTHNSSTITWISNDYIEDSREGTVTLLEFGQFYDIGQTIPSPVNPDTFANLTNKSVESGTLILESELQIKVSEVVSTSSVTCMSETGARSTYTIQSLADPDMPPNAVSTQTKDLNGNCILHISWNTPDNAAIVEVTHFTVNIDGSNVINETNHGNGSLVQVAYALCNCDSQEISISAVNRCGHIGLSSPTITPEYPKPIPRLECDTNDTTLTDESTESDVIITSTGSGSTNAIVIPSVAAGIIGVMLYIQVVCTC